MAEAQHNTPDNIIFVIHETLTDGSIVYSVRFGEREFAATGQEEAEDFAHALADAINDYTTETAGVVIET